MACDDPLRASKAGLTYLGFSKCPSKAAPGKLDSGAHAQRLLVRNCDQF